MTGSFHGGRTTGALVLSLSAISCGANVSTSLGECSPSSSSQSKPASPTISLVTGWPSELHRPISRLRASTSARKRLGSGWICGR